MRNGKFILLGLVLISCYPDSAEIFEPEIEARADIVSIEKIGYNEFNIEGEEIGTASFAQDGNIVRIKVDLKNMTPNSSKSVHLHNGSIEKPGRHWNQQSFYAFCKELSMGSPWGKPFAGDVGNVQIDENGMGTLTILTDLWALNSGDEKDILDKVVIVHDDPEDFAYECDPFHVDYQPHSNLKIGGGYIKLQSEIEQKAQTASTSFPDFTICR